MDKIATVAEMVRTAEKHLDAGAGDRKRAVDYYEGVMSDVPSDTNRSKMVTRDVRSSIKKVLPSLIRTILGSDEVVEYLPVGPNDEDGAAQSSDYMNGVVFAESDARRAIHDALHDALLLRNGILNWRYEEKTCVSTSHHSGINDDAFAELVEDDEVEVLEHTSSTETIEVEGQTLEVPAHEAKIRRTFKESNIKAGSTPRDRFLIHPDAVTLADSPLVGEKTTLTRSDIVAMGYDRKVVDTFAETGHDDNGETTSRRDAESGKTEADRANELVDYYDVYVRVDMDGDGIAELRHMVFAGGLAEKNLLENDECDEVQYCDIAVMFQPHQWEGVSLFDDTWDIQRAKTVLFRQTLDNLYWQNNPQPVGQRGSIENIDAVLNPEFGKPIWIKQGVDARAALGFNSVPFVARDSFGMLEYMDAEITDRTGVSDASAGLAPDALQNMTAKASAMIEQAGIGQTELMVRTAAEGLRVFFRGLLRLTIKHQDMPRTVRLRDKWVEIDPRQWNAEMDCVVNTGLGAGTRERDMTMMMQVLGLQEKMIAGFGADNPFVKPENLSNVLDKLVESSGLKTPSLYFTTPDPEEMKAQMEARKAQKSPEQMKLEGQMQLEQAKMQSNAAKEKAQMDADLQVKQAEIQAHSQAQAEKLASDAALQGEKLAFERERFTADLQFKREQAAQGRQDEIWKAQAAGIQTDTQEAS